MSTDQPTPIIQSTHYSPTVIVSAVTGVIILTIILIITYGGFNPNKTSDANKVSFQKSSQLSSKITTQTFDQPQAMNVEFKEFKLLGFRGDRAVADINEITTYKLDSQKANLNVISAAQIQNNKSNPNYNKNLEDKIQIDQFISNKDSTQNSNITNLYRTSLGDYSSIFLKNIEYTMSGLESQRAFLTADGQSPEASDLVLNVIGTKNDNYVWTRINLYTDQNPQPDGLSMKATTAANTSANKSLQTKSEPVYFGTEQFKKDLDLATARLNSTFVLEK